MSKVLSKAQIRKKFGRFPVTDLAIAIARPAARRESFLRIFLAGEPAYSFRAVRQASHAIYGVNLPLAPLPRETWEQVKALIKEKARPHEYDLNVTAAKLLVKLISSRSFAAFPYDKQFIQVGPGRTIPLELSYYLVEADRIIFQYLQPRAEPAFDDRTALCLASLVNMAYAFGDYASADIEIADLSAVHRAGSRQPRFRTFSKSMLLTPADLSAEINDIYSIMKKLYDEA
jgi:hypothetical protein